MQSKRDKHQRELRQALTLWPALLPPAVPIQSLLATLYPQMTDLSLLRIMSLIEINYLFGVYLDILEANSAQKQGTLSVENVRVGIIGGGIIGRLALNSILVFIKAGIDPRNITVSTRQVEGLLNYKESFGVKIVFDNETVARESHFLLVCTPATLDNWIITDLQRPLKSRGDGKKEAKEAKYPKPVVYILTSDFTNEKCDKLFPFVILTPAVRARDLPAVKKLIGGEDCQRVETYERVWAKWMCRPVQELSLTDSNWTAIERAMRAMAYTVEISTVLSSSASQSVSSIGRSDAGQKQPLWLKTGNQQELLVRCLRWRTMQNSYLG